MNNIIQHFDLNSQGRDFVVGDIHGYFNLLQQKLDQVKFNPDTDRLFSLGDMIDRGPYSREVLKWIDKPWFFAIKGNHEVMCDQWYNNIDWQKTYAKHGGQWFIDLHEYEQEYYIRAFKQLLNIFEIETPNGLIGLVHAEVPVTDWIVFKNNFNQYEEQSLWSFNLSNIIKYVRDPYVTNIDYVIHGHSNQHQPTIYGNRIYIDTGYLSNELTLVEINNKNGLIYHHSKGIKNG